MTSGSVAAAWERRHPGGISLNSISSVACPMPAGSRRSQALVLGLAGSHNRRRTLLKK